MKTKIKPLILLSIILVLAAQACRTKTQLKYGLLSCYTMDGDEKEATVDKQALKLYDTVVRTARIQSYINKYTVSETNKKYFSHVLADLPDSIHVKIKADTSFNIINERNIEAHKTTYYCYNVKKNNGLAITKIHFRQPDLTNSLLIDAVFDTQEHSLEFYNNAEKFIQKMVCADEKK